MPAPIVFFDIAGPDAVAQQTFYRNVLDWTPNAGGMVSVQVSAPLMGSLRTDPANKIIYFGVPDINAAMHKVAANGGKVVAPRFEVKGVVVLGLFTDPAGNGLGFVELDGDKPRIP
jgi:predicted enzyme related to lactoylglutathione lyase